jgi:hypothetical protein
MTSNLNIKKIFQEAAKEVEKPTPLKELTSSIMNVERKYVYGEASSNNRLRLIRELIEGARKKGDIC